MRWSHLPCFKGLTKMICFRNILSCTCSSLIEMKSGKLKLNLVLLYNRTPFVYGCYSYHKAISTDMTIQWLKSRVFSLH